MSYSHQVDNGLHKQTSSIYGIDGLYAAQRQTEKSNCISFSEVYERYQSSDIEAALDKLRERFSNVSFSAVNTRKATMENVNRRDTISVQITENLLARMANDPDEFKRVAEKIEFWLSAAAEFAEKIGGMPHRMGMSISEYGTLIWTSSKNLSGEKSDEDLDLWKRAWDRFIETLLEWFRNREEKCVFEELDDYEDAVA
ncbi:MAG: DUF6033 family protein [Oscillospiraceae bacterium]|nr:DUF6033 family protein [Oscillospiraceae bacterium]MCL2279662.1 DUF6033 family protein [Oscillospiraceae bacterium]